MGRRRREQRSGSPDRDDDETSSVAPSELSRASSPGAEEVEVDPGTKLLDAMDNIKTKRRETREIGISSAIQELRARYHGDSLSGREETTVATLLRVIKRVPKRELVAMGLVLDAAIVTIGPEQQGLHDDIAKAMVPTVMSCSLTKGADAAARTLGLSTLVFSTTPESALEVLSLLREVLMGRYARSAKAAGAAASAGRAGQAGGGTPQEAAARAARNGVDPTVGEAALEAWGMVAAAQSRSWLRGPGMTDHALVIAQYLFAPKLPCRAAAARCLSVLFEARREEGADGESVGSAGEGDAGEEKEYEGEGDEEEEDEEDTVLEDEVDVIARLRDLSRMNPRHLKRRERKEQRAIFRRLLDAVEDGRCPEEEIQLGTEGAVPLRTWREVAMMQGMRRVLAGGLDTHLRTNPLLSDMFSVRISARGGDGARMSTAEKRAMKARRAREARHRGQKRHAARVAKGGGAEA